MRKITFITIFLVLFFNIGACILYAESYRTAGLILKGLGDGYVKEICEMTIKCNEDTLETLS